MNDDKKLKAALREARRLRFLGTIFDSRADEIDDHADAIEDAELEEYRIKS